MVRVRHYTKKSSKDKIILDGVILAQDQNKVFVERVNGEPSSPRRAEALHGLKYGKGNAYVEFDVEEAELEEQMNATSGKMEFFLRGEVDLTDRGATGHDNP